MHLETGPHSILYNSPFVCFSAARARTEPRPDSTNRYSPSSRAALLAANPFFNGKAAKQQSCANSTRYVTSYLAFRKIELCALEGWGGSGFASAAMPTSTQSHALGFPQRCKILHGPEARHMPLHSGKRSSTAEAGHAKLKPASACSLWIVLRWWGTSRQSVAEQVGAHSWITACYWAQA